MWCITSSGCRLLAALLQDPGGTEQSWTPPQSAKMSCIGAVGVMCRFDLS